MLAKGIGELIALHAHGASGLRLPMMALHNINPSSTVPQSRSVCACYICGYAQFHASALHDA